MKLIHDYMTTLKAMQIVAYKYTNHIATLHIPPLRVLPPPVPVFTVEVTSKEVLDGVRSLRYEGVAGVGRVDPPSSKVSGVVSLLLLMCMTFSGHRLE